MGSVDNLMRPWPLLPTSSHKVPVGISRKKAGESEPKQSGRWASLLELSGPLLSGKAFSNQLLPAGSPWLCWYSWQRWTPMVSQAPRPSLSLPRSHW